MWGREQPPHPPLRSDVFFTFSHMIHVRHHLFLKSVSALICTTASIPKLTESQFLVWHNVNLSWWFQCSEGHYWTGSTGLIAARLFLGGAKASCSPTTEACLNRFVLSLTISLSVEEGMFQHATCTVYALTSAVKSEVLRVKHTVKAPPKIACRQRRRKTVNLPLKWWYYALLM